jgi:hypothetical protein
MTGRCASNFNRAFETAVLAGFKDIEKTTDLTEGGLVVSRKRTPLRRRATRWRRSIMEAGVGRIAGPTFAVGEYLSKRARPIDQDCARRISQDR